MVAVFEADAAKYGLKTRHKALLLAYANHSNKHGYCWPGTKLLMNETGMGESTLQRVKAELVDMDLIGVKPRFAADGSQISNLVRLNVERLRAMRWEGRDDTEDLIDAITFEEDGTSSQVAGGSQIEGGEGPNLGGTPPQIEEGGGPDLGPKPSEEPSEEPPPPSPPSHESPASATAGDAPAARGEGEGSPEETRRAPAGSVPSPRAAAEGQDAERDERLAAARRLLEALPAPIRPGGRTVRALAPAVADALAAGWTPETLTARLTADLPATVRSVRALLTHRLDDLPPPPLAEEPRPALPPHCGDARCRGGWLEDENGLPVGRCESWPHQTGPVLIHAARAPLA